MEGVEQICDFKTASLFINTYDGPFKDYFYCGISGDLENAEENVTTNTKNNSKSNDEVTMVYYFGGAKVKFIPNSIFTTFKNLEVLFVNDNNQLSSIKPEYFKNSKSLRALRVLANPVTTLDANVFVEAPSLEFIDFFNCQIKYVSRLAFNDLPNLKGIFLKGSQVISLHPNTFSSITTLNWLILTPGANCVNEDFLEANQKFAEIEGKITEKCSY